MIRFTVWDKILVALVVIGAINWGLIGFFNYNLISAIFGYMSAFSRVVYAVVGLAGLGALFILFRHVVVGRYEVHD